MQRFLHRFLAKVTTNETSRADLSPVEQLSPLLSLTCSAIQNLVKYCLCADSQQHGNVKVFWGRFTLAPPQSPPGPGRPLNSGFWRHKFNKTHKIPLLVPYLQSTERRVLILHEYNTDVVLESQERFGVAHLPKMLSTHALGNAIQIQTRDTLGQESSAAWRSKAMFSFSSNSLACWLLMFPVSTKQTCLQVDTIRAI
mgnify:CR=1 FL=1